MHRDLCDFLLEIVQNSIEAGSTHISVEWLHAGSSLKMRVEDNGKGMSPDEIKKLEDPYFTDGSKHVKRKAGLGIPLLAQTLQMTGGSYSVTSTPGIRTEFSCIFRLDHIDTPPIGNFSEAMMSIFTMSGEYELTVRCKKDEHSEYTVRRSELLEALGELETVDSQILLKQYLESHENE